jgi:hypothetical protein
MNNSKTLRLLLVALMMVSSTALMAQTMKSFTWDSYKTKFSVPSNFRVTKSSGEIWSGTNDDITMSIYPRKGENLTQRQMNNAVYTWAVDNGVANLGEGIELDPEKLNGYWGVLYEGTIDGFPVGTMLLVDPDYPDISLYVWVSYRSDFEDTVIDMLMSFTPN